MGDTTSEEWPRWITSGGRLSISPGGRPDVQLPIQAVEASPCTLACPAGVNVKGYVSLIGAGRFQESLELIRRDCPLPSICGRICHRPCEAACRRGQTDHPVAIGDLKRFVADYELSLRRAATVPPARTRPERVAVVGSGPAGLTVASDLVHRGFGVTVFEAFSEPGGMLVQGIPEFRLPREIIRAEVQSILDLGVELRTGLKIGRDVGLSELFESEGFGAVFLGIGAHLPRKLQIRDGEGVEGIEDGLEFMRRVNAGDRRRTGRHAVVIGGGHTALDCARTALRLGVEDVQVLYRRTAQEMPAAGPEVEEAEGEGVRFNFLRSPAAVLRRGGRVIALECLENTLGPLDASGRRRPVPVLGSQYIVETDWVLLAVGQTPESDLFDQTASLQLSPAGTLAADADSLATSLPGVFAGGDAVTGPKSVIDAIAQGHRAAVSIESFLDTGMRQPASAEWEPIPQPAEFEIPHRWAQRSERQRMPQLPVAERQATFREVNLGLSQRAAMREAQRCLRCGPCRECSLCTSNCNKKHVRLSLGGPDAEAGTFLLRIPKEGGGLAAYRTGNLGTLHWTSRTGATRQTSTVMHPLTCWVRGERCRGCGICAETCAYGAITLGPGAAGVASAQVEPELCKGCGVCMSLCPTGAIQSAGFSDWAVAGRLRRLPPNSKVVFSCRFNAAVGSFLQARHGDGFEHVPVMCAGRIAPAQILEALEAGAQRVLLVRCPPRDCHYGSGSQVAQESFDTAAELLRLLGLEPHRLQLLTVGPEGDALREYLQESSGGLEATHV